MTMDSSRPIRRPRSPDLWRLPEVREVRIRRRRFDPPRRVTTAGVDREEEVAIEVEISLSESFPVRALGPVLWIGDEPLTIAESDGKTTYRFFSFDPEALARNAPISLAWNSPNAPRRETSFRYRPPAE
jgi:hypothetical protein